MKSTLQNSTELKDKKSCTIAVEPSPKKVQQKDSEEEKASGSSVEELTEKESLIEELVEREDTIQAKAESASVSFTKVRVLLLTRCR